MLSAKNVQCMRALLSMAHCHGGVMGTGQIIDACP